ncbi:MAG TPA: RidA family protein [Solirubrobacterales bacterium]|nr:RidA family protein [Solirubrobacterales bacterium]
MSTLPIAQTRVCGNLVFTAGQLGFDADGSVPPEFGRQVELAIEALRTQLEAAGASLESVLKVTNFLVNRSDFAEMNEIYARYFSEPFPTRSTLLVGLAGEEFLFEIEAVAERTGA